MSFFDRLFGFTNRKHNFKNDFNDPMSLEFNIPGSRKKSHLLDNFMIDTETQTNESFIGKFKDVEVETTIQVPVSLALMNVISKMNQKIKEIETLSQTEETEVESPEVSHTSSENHSPSPDNRFSFFSQNDNMKITRTNSGFTPVLLKRRPITKKVTESNNENLEMIKTQSIHENQSFSMLISPEESQIQLQEDQKQSHEVKIPPKEDQIQPQEDQIQSQEDQIQPQKDRIQAQGDRIQIQEPQVQSQEVPQGNTFRTLFVSRFERGPPIDLGGFHYTPITSNLNRNDQAPKQQNQFKNQRKYRNTEQNSDSVDNDNDENDNDDETISSNTYQKKNNNFNSNRGRNNSRSFQFNRNNNDEGNRENNKYNNKNRGRYNNKRGGNSNYNKNDETEENNDNHNNNFNNRGGYTAKRRGNKNYNRFNSGEKGDNADNADNNNRGGNTRRRGGNSNYNNNTRRFNNTNNNNKNFKFNPKFNISNNENNDDEE